MGQSQKEAAVEKYLKEKYGTNIEITILAELEQSWGMIGDDFEVTVKNTAEGEKHIAVYVKKVDTEYKVVTVFDRTHLDSAKAAEEKNKTVCSLPESAEHTEDGDVSRLNQWQLERLCNIVYLDAILNGNKKFLHEFMDGLRAQIDEGVNLPCEMGKREWTTILDSIQKDSALLGLKMIDYDEVKCNKPKADPDVLKGQRVVCFADNNRGVYVIYRGTYGAEEWNDNADGMTQQDTIQQKAALTYLMHIKETFKPVYIAVAGHSKGGNKAQYVTLTAPDNIVNYGLSIDGQGFSRKFIEHYADNIKKRGQLHLIAEQRDFVNCLGFYVNSVPGCASKATIFYRGWRGCMGAEDNLFGSPFPHFHCPDALRLWDSKIAPDCGPGEIPLMVNHLLTFFLEDTSIMESVKKRAAKIMVSLMTKDPKEWNEVLEAALILLKVFAQLWLKDNNFTQKLQNILYLEHGVIFASIFNSTKSKDFALDGEVLELDEVACSNIFKLIIAFVGLIITISSAEDAWKSLTDFFVAIFNRCMESTASIYALSLLITLTISLIISLSKSTEHKEMINKLWEGREDKTKLQFKEMRAELENISEDRLSLVEKPYLAKTKQMMDELIAQF